VKAIPPSLKSSLLPTDCHPSKLTATA